MSLFIGIDTSNYATSLCAFDTERGIVFHDKRMLPVKAGSLGLRQSDAVFEHVRALPDMLRKMTGEVNIKGASAVGVSARPRDCEGSYMPCFLAGVNSATAMAGALGIPLLELSHQAGHLLSALYATPLYNEGTRDFFAFHVSGGTTDAVSCRMTGAKYEITQLATSLDAHAGQLVDRLGGLLGMSFPSGAAISALAEISESDEYMKPTLKGGDCCLSGLENKCAEMLGGGREPRDVARYCLNSIAHALLEMTEALNCERADKPIIYAGGVMQSGIIRTLLRKNVKDAYFAEPAWLSADNAAGAAIYAYEAKK